MRTCAQRGLLISLPGKLVLDAGGALARGEGFCIMFEKLVLMGKSACVACVLGQ